MDARASLQKNISGPYLYPLRIDSCIEASMFKNRQEDV
jgi:hypothetical protein